MAEQDRPEQEGSSEASDGRGRRILTINGGSSSVKFALFAPGEPPARLLSGSVDRIGLGDATLKGQDAAGACRESRPIEAPDHTAALGAILEWLGGQTDWDAISAIGHRVVHGGKHHSEPERVTQGLVDELRRIRHYDPDHLPAEIELIEACRRHDPGLPQVLCFDTAFHRDMPRVARLLPIPRRFDAVGVRRYGFHGLSFTYLLEELGRVAGPESSRGRVILAHLGNGASLAAVRDGRGIDTTMGFTPAAGLVMGTRSGDLDPGLVSYLAHAEGMTAEQFDFMVNHRSGLLGVSETSPDMRDLLAHRGEDVRAAEAVALFCYQARKWVGAMAAALGGLDTLVFAGGIGENAPEVRAGVCDGLGFLGVELDKGRNGSNAPVISVDGGRVAVRVIPTDEELTVARAVSRVLDGPPSDRAG